MTVLPCRLYIKEFHLIADTEIGDEVAGSFYKGAKSNGVEVAYNGGGRWVVKPSDGERLEGQLDTIEQLFLVRPSATPDKDGKLISVKVSGICPVHPAVISRSNGWAMSPTNRTPDRRPRRQFESLPKTPTGRP